MWAAILTGCSSAPTSPAPVESVYRGPTFHNYERSSLSADIYEVQRGDTLYTIAFRANQDLRAIAQLNNLSEPYLIFAGQQLRLRPSAGDVPNSHNNSTTNQTNVITEGVARSASNAYGSVESSPKSDEKQTAGSNQPVVPAAPAARSAAAPSAAVTAPPAVPQRTPERVNNNQLRWQWPSSGTLVRRFSNHEMGGKGIEFSGQRGDPVIAAAAGRVVYVGSALRGYGQLIILKHNDDFITAYGHNDSILVREQQWIEAGQQIATMGSSGRDDVRLRFELRFRGNSVNPENYLPRTR